MKKAKLFISCLCGSLILLGCSNDESVGEPEPGGTELTADFSYSNDGSEFTFTNLSGSGYTYRWDFGDLGFISNDENPVHSYTIGGELIVSLTITDENGNEGYVAKKITAPEQIIIAIEIDGDFEDWDNVEVAEENVSGEGAIRILKYWTVGENINFYLEGTSDMNMEIGQIYINTDGDANSGFLADDWPDNSGAEIMFEGPFENDSWGNFFQQGEGSGWAFDDVVEGSSAADINISEIGTVSGGANAIEFSIKKSILGNLGDTIGIGILELNSSWGTVSVFPNTGNFSIIDL